MTPYFGVERLSDDRIPPAGSAEAASGYRHRTYAESLDEHGTVLPLPNAGGWLLERSIPGTDLKDAMGCYPLMCCARWPVVGDDLRGLAGRVVAVSAVIDPFGGYSLDDLRHAFDVVRPFKEHFVVDLSIPPSRRLSRNHRRNVRQAARSVSVERCGDPRACLDDWTALYRDLVRRHQVRGIAAFSRRAFERQFQVPGLVAYRASVAGKVCGMALWYLSEAVAYYHLAASTETGYRHQATYALVAAALDEMRQEGCRWANLGAGAGLRADANDGLSYFKAGWSTGTRTAHLCGRILDHAAYDHLAAMAGRQCTSFFPAYRRGEFG